MNKLYSLVSFLIFFAFVQQINTVMAQETITSWNFDQQNLNPVSGTGTAMTIGGTTGTFSTGNPNLYSWSTTDYPAQATFSGIAGVQFSVSTVGFTNIIVNWENRNSANAANRTRLKYTINGTDWLDFTATAANATNINDGNPVGFDAGRYITNASDWFFRSADFTAIPGVAQNPAFAIRLVTEFEDAVNYGATVTAYAPEGTIRFENVTFSGTVSIPPPSITSVILPQFISGNTPANNRLPFAFRATINYLEPSTEYRYYNVAVTSSDAPTSTGSGAIIFVNSDGTFTRTPVGSLATEGDYATFTTDASGSYTGWFITEPSTNTRFTPGNQLFMRIILNDGNNGTTAETILTTSESVAVLGFGAGATPTEGTGIYASSLAGSKNFCMLYDNVNSTGRPLFGTSIETTGIDFSSLSYAAFFKNNVAGENGAWGAIIPNINFNGIRAIEERSLTSGSVVSTMTSPDGMWGTTNTANPAGGNVNVLVLNLYPETNPVITDETVPLFIQGINNTNDQRVPFAFHTVINNLIPNATYRYYNKVVLSTDLPTEDGAGNMIFVNSNGTFTRTDNPSLSASYGSFVADENGSYSGWFITESTGDIRFTPGNQLYMRIMLNNGFDGTDVADRLTTITCATVINFGTEGDPESGTGLRGISSLNPGNFVYMYANEDGIGRPVYATSIESTGIDFTTAGSYAEFFTGEVEGIDGSWGGIVPNILPSGIKRIEERSLVDGSIVYSQISTNGIWGTTNTQNPDGGDLNELVIELLPPPTPVLIVNPSSLSGFSYVVGNGPSSSQSYSLTAEDLTGSGNIIVTSPEHYEISQDDEVFTTVLELPFADGTITGQPVTIYARLKAGLTEGSYENEIVTHTGGGAEQEIETLHGYVEAEGLPGISNAIIPEFIQGNEGTNNTRVPYAFMVSINNLNPDATYRYFNKAVIGTDNPDYTGVGNTIFVNADGTFNRTTGSSLSTPGQYGEFTTDSDGEYRGWFMLEPTGNERFTPGNQLFMRLMLNDGNEGTDITHYFTTQEYATVLTFETEQDPTQGTSIRGISEEQAGNFVLLYKAIGESERPVFGTSIESTGIDFASTGLYAPFYSNIVAGVNGSWGGIVPNMNPDGIRMIKVFLHDEYTETTTYSMPSGIWGITDTRNPSGGVDEVLFIDLTETAVSSIDPATAKLWYSNNTINIETKLSGQYTLELINMQGRITGTYQLSGNSNINVNLPAGIYIARITNGQTQSAGKLVIR